MLCAIVRRGVKSKFFKRSEFFGSKALKSCEVYVIIISA